MSGPDGRLSGCRALVTGGLGGIGLATTEAFLREGAEVWLADLPAADSDDIATALRRVPAARYVQLDVTRSEDWKAIAKTLGGTLDILVNDAGIAAPAAIGDATENDWQRTLSVNSTSAFLALTHLAPLLAQAAIKNGRWASVINVSSILANVGLAQTSAYAASKGALRSFTKAAAVEFAEAGKQIRVNSLHAGFVLTAMTRGGSDAMDPASDLLASLAAQTPMRRIADPAEIANAVLFLASTESSFMTGSELTIDGGWTAR